MSKRLRTHLIVALLSLCVLLMAAVLCVNAPMTANAADGVATYADADQNGLRKVGGGEIESYVLPNWNYGTLKSVNDFFFRAEYRDDNKDYVIYTFYPADSDEMLRQFAILYTFEASTILKPAIEYYELVDGRLNSAPENRERIEDSVNSGNYLLTYCQSLPSGNYVMKVTASAIVGDCKLWWTGTDDTVPISYLEEYTETFSFQVEGYSFSNGGVTWEWPENKTVEYNGKANNMVKPTVKLRLDDDDESIRLLVEGEDYVLSSDRKDVGTATLIITGINNYSGELTVGDAFEIVKARNGWIDVPNITSWVFDRFNKENNRIVATPKFLDNADHMWFAIYRDGLSGEKEIMDGLEHITLDGDGYVSEEVATALNKLSYRQYYLYAHVEGTDNYDELTTEAVPFRVFQANNSWLVLPNIVEWKYGEFNADFNRVLAMVSCGTIYVQFTDAEGENITDRFELAESGKVPENVAAILAELDQGEYKFVVQVEVADTNYTQIPDVDPITFHVAPVANEWLVSPSVIQWQFGGFDTTIQLILGTAKCGQVNFTILAEDMETALTSPFVIENGQVTDAEALAVLQNLNYGKYYLKASVAEGTSYTGLNPDPVEFMVAQAPNGWKDTFNVIHWNYGDYNPNVNLIIGSVQHGTVTFAIFKDGFAVKGLEAFTSVDENVSGILEGLPAGRYSIRATVSGNSNYASIEEQNINFEIGKGSNDWKDTFNVINWNYGDYNKAVNLIIGSVKHGTVTFTVSKDGAEVEGLEAFTSVDESIAGILAGLPAGVYSIRASITADVNYMGLDEQNVDFEIGRGRNDWKDTFNIIHWNYGDYDMDINLIIGSVEHGTVRFSVLQNGVAVHKDLASFTFVDGARATLLSELPAGYYTLKATVSENPNYVTLDEQSIDFEIGKGKNDWKVPVDVIGWAYGNYDRDTNLLMGSVINGTVMYSVTKDGENILGLEGFTEVDDTIAGIFEKLAVGDYTVTATVSVDSNYEPVNSGTATLTVAKAVNTWTTTPSISSWVKGEYNAEENVAIATDMFGSAVDYEIYDSTNPENVIYKVENGEVVIDNLASAEVGFYTLKAIILDTDNYGGLERTFSFQIFAPEGLAWWAWLLIIVAILGVIALVFWILHEKGVLQMLTGRIVVAMRAKMTVDATIAAVRANKRAEEARKSIAKAEAMDRLEAAKKAREEARNMTPEQRAAALEEKAAAQAAKAEKLQKQAERMQNQANRLMKSSETAEESTEAPSVEEAVASEATAVDVPTNNADEE